MGGGEGPVRWWQGRGAGVWREGWSEGRGTVERMGGRERVGVIEGVDMWRPEGGNRSSGGKEMWRM